jgi:hypothetical protein
MINELDAKINSVRQDHQTSYSTGSDHDRHGVTSSAPTPQDSSAFLCHHDAVTHDTAQLKAARAAPQCERSARS